MTGLTNRAAGRVAGATRIALECTAERHGENYTFPIERFLQLSGKAPGAEFNLHLGVNRGSLFGQVEVEAGAAVRRIAPRPVRLAEAVAIVAIKGGEMAGVTPAGPLHVGAEEVCFLDMRESFAIEADQMQASLCVIRLKALAGAFRQGDVHGRVFHSGSSLTRMLHEAILTAVAARARQVDAAVEDLSAPLAALAGACLRSEAGFVRGEASATTSPLTLIKRYIDTRLFEPDLSVDHPARELGMARASLYRQFEPLGGIADYIRSQRLQHAKRELALRSHGTLQLQTLAKRLGFKSAAHLSRAFVQAFGQSPRAFYSQSRGGNGSASTSSRRTSENQPDGSNSN